MRLIDADELIKQRQFIVAEADGLCGDVVWVRDIQGAPTIEAVPVADFYEILLSEKAESWKEGFAEGIKVERQHNETVEELARNGYQEDE